MKLNKKTKIIICVIAVILVIAICLLVLFNKGVFGNKNNSVSNKTSIKIYKEENEIKASTDNIIDNIITNYECSNNNCKVLDINPDKKEILISDENLITYNYENNESKNIDITEYDDVKYVFNDLSVKKEDKYALYNKEDNKYTSEFIYDGIVTKEEDKVVAYTNTSKYNQESDIYVNNELTTHYNYCVNTDNEEKELYCSVHVEGKITNEEVDLVIDKVLSQYPNLENKRLFLIKTAIEAVGLPYLWGGGHSTLENTLDIAERDWNTKMVYLYNGFKNQVAGQSYPSGLDCAGFVRWAVYVASGLDIYKDHVNVISGRNTDVTLIPHEELLPGDIITDPDHITIYLYKDDEGKDISVHASYTHLQVEVSNYKRGNTYWRINPWME